MTKCYEEMNETWWRRERVVCFSLVLSTPWPMLGSESASRLSQPHPATEGDPAKSLRGHQRHGNIFAFRRRHSIANLFSPHVAPGPPRHLHGLSLRICTRVTCTFSHVDRFAAISAYPTPPRPPTNPALTSKKVSSSPWPTTGNKRRSASRSRRRA